jgi:predicted nucleic acid-binding protein
MIVVADTSPVCYLILIDQADLLSALFDSVLLPRAVLDELLHEDAPERLKEWAAQLPSWVRVHDHPLGMAADLDKLHARERNVILLAEALHADIVLLDEKAARRVATDRGLRVTGTLGVLGEAAEQGSSTSWQLSNCFVRRTSATPQRY